MLGGRQILVAANGFARRLLPDLQVTPGRGYIFVTESIDNMPWRGIFHHDRGYIYFRNVGDRLLLGGARNQAEDEETTDQFGINTRIKDYLVKFASETLKLPKGWQIEQEWSGIMGFTETKTPIVKRVNEAVFVAAGLSGMGIAIGMKVGEEAVELLDSKSE
ncbi:MAG: FAD-dependent oxidoreductase [Balneolaceae bacterium]|nr:FAD-dependent oxidoreductase [Balneolaceae bacterium]